MSEEQRSAKNIVDELSRLGNQVAEALRLAWESDKRKKLQAEIAEGLKKFGDEVEEAVRTAGESDAAKQVIEQAEKVATTVRESDVVEDVQRGLLTSLEALNKELGKLLEKLQADQVPATPTEPEAPAEPPKGA